jgi:hypothetical protein
MKFKVGDKVYIKNYGKEAVVISILGVDPEENTSKVQYYDVQVEESERTFYPTIAEYNLELIDV